MVLGGARGAAGARAARGLAALASSVSGFEAPVFRRREGDGPASWRVCVLGWAGAAARDFERVAEAYLDKWPEAAWSMFPGRAADRRLPGARR